MSRQSVLNYLELARISNLPTCVTNVLVGVALGGGEAFAWPTTIALCVAISLLYASGMALNDAFDVAVDRVERPMRPIPSGRISLRSAYRFVFVTLACGLVVLNWVGWVPFGFGLLLATTIILYNFLHKRHAWTAILMGLCRGWVYVLAASAVAWPLDWERVVWFAAALALYTTGVTLVAQCENDDRIGARRYLALLIAVVVLFPIVVVPLQRWALPIASGLVLAFWLGRSARRVVGALNPQVRQAVLGWLSGICLVDAFFLSLLGRPLAVGTAFVAFVITRAAHRRILGT